MQNERFLKSSCEVEKVALDDELATIKQIRKIYINLNFLFSHLSSFF